MILNLLTALAFLYFNEEKVDFLILEVGLGGRLDSTNVIEDKLLAIIAHIGLEHTAPPWQKLGKDCRRKSRHYCQKPSRCCFTTGEICPGR